MVAPTKSDASHYGKAKLAQLSKNQIVEFLLGDYVRRNPHFASHVIKGEKTRLQNYCADHGVESVHGRLAKLLNERLDYRIYSLSKRLDNMGMWAKYARRTVPPQFKNEKVSPKR